MFKYIQHSLLQSINKKSPNSSPCKWLRSHTGKSTQAASEHMIDDLAYQHLGNANEGSNKVPTEWKLNKKFCRHYLLKFKVLIIWGT